MPRAPPAVVLGHPLSILGLAQMGGGQLPPPLVTRLNASCPGAAESLSTPSVELRLHGAPPTTTAAALGLLVVLDGHLIDQAQLCERLGISSERPDAEIVVHALRRYPPEHALRLMDGDFAGLAYDSTQRQAMLFGDCFGVRPMNYTTAGTVLIFGTCAHEVAQTANHTPRLDAQSCLEHLTKLHPRVDRTFFSGVKRLPPCHFLQPPWMEPRRYFSFADRLPEVPQTDREVQQELRARIDRAVESRCGGQHRLGILLSSGLDSSALTISAAQTHELRTLTAVSEAIPRCNESDGARALCAELGLPPPRIISADDINPFHWVSRQPSCAGPSRGTNALFTGTLIQKHGDPDVPLLVGSGGELLAPPGLAVVDEHLAWLRLGPLWTELQANEKPASRYLAALVHRRLRPFRQMPSTPRYIVPGWENLLEASLQENRRLFKPLSSQFATHLRSLQHPIHAMGLQLFHSWSSHYGQPVLTPFYDRSLVHFGLALPWHQKRRGGWSRYVLREAYAERRPMGGSWLKKPIYNALSQRLVVRAADPSAEDFLRQRLDAVEHFVDSRTLMQLYRRYRKQPNHAQTGLIWRAASLGCWIESLAFNVAVER